VMKSKSSELSPRTPYQ